MVTDTDTPTAIRSTIRVMDTIRAMGTLRLRQATRARGTETEITATDRATDRATTTARARVTTGAMAVATARARTANAGTGRTTSIRRMPKLSRRAGTFGLALTLWDVWKRIPPKHRKQIMKQARKHGPKLAARAMQAQQARRNKRPR
jgi:hypothetical protein